MERIDIMRYAIHCGHVKQYGFLLLRNNNRLTCHFKLCVHFGQHSSAGRQVNLVVIVATIKYEVTIERTLEVLKFLAVKGNICQLCIV